MYRYLKKINSIITIVIGLTVVVSPVYAKGNIKVGVLQYVEHESLNATYQGFIDGLAEAGYKEGDHLEIDFLNAGADNANLQSMAEKLVNANDYLFAIATPAAQILANTTKDKPIYFSAVTDPINAGLVKNLEIPNGNITGTIDVSPLEEQVKLLRTVAPKAKVVGLLYNAGEANSQSEASRAKRILESRGFIVEEATVTSTNDISQVMASLVDEVDVIFTVTDNTVASAMTLVGDLAIEAGLPLVGGSEDMVLENGLVTYGINYYHLGKQTAAMLVRQIEEGLEIAKMPIESAAENHLIINEKVAEKLGIDTLNIKIE